MSPSSRRQAAYDHRLGDLAVLEPDPPEEEIEEPEDDVEPDEDDVEEQEPEAPTPEAAPQRAVKARRKWGKR